MYAKMIWCSAAAAEERLGSACCSALGVLWSNFCQKLAFYILLLAPE